MQAIVPNSTKLRSAAAPIEILSTRFPCSFSLQMKASPSSGEADGSVKRRIVRRIRGQKTGIEDASPPQFAALVKKSAMQLDTGLTMPYRFGANPPACRASRAWAAGHA